MTTIETNLSVLQLVVWFGMGVSLWFYAMSVYGTWDFFRHRQREDEVSDDWAPPVTILKPLKGADASLYSNLLTFCDQAYPRFQILFGIADARDAAVQVVRRLQRAYPHLDIGLVIDSRVHGTNYKIANLMNMEAQVKYDIVLLSDGDIRVPRDYVLRLVAPLRDESIGLVHCLYRAVGPKRLPTKIESLFINTDFAPQVLVARKIEKPAYAFGASIAIRRSTLEAIGGFAGLVNLLADDYYLGHRVARLGLRLWLSDCVVETVLDVASWKHLLQHQLRWARTYRTCRPGGYFGTLFTQGVLWAVANLFVGGFGGLAIALSAVQVSARIFTSAWVSWRYLRTNLRPLDLLLVPVKDLFMSAIWFVSFFGDTVWWSGRCFRILKSGEMELIAVEPEVAAADVAVKQAS